jgi:hypothetical protein
MRMQTCFSAISLAALLITGMAAPALAEARDHGYSQRGYNNDYYRGQGRNETGNHSWRRGRNHDYDRHDNRHYDDRYNNGWRERYYYPPRYYAQPRYYYPSPYYGPPRYYSPYYPPYSFGLRGPNFFFEYSR